MGEHRGGGGPGEHRVLDLDGVDVREHLVGLGEREIEVAGPHRGLGAAGGQPQRGAPAATAAAYSRPATGSPARAASSAPATNTSAARAPVAPVSSNPRAAVRTDPPRSSSISARVRRISSLRAPGTRCRIAVATIGERAVRGEVASRAGLLDELVDLVDAATGRVGEPEQRHEHLGVARGAQRERDEQLADPLLHAVDGVAELLDELLRRPGRQAAGPLEPGAVGADLVEQAGQEAVDEGREARRLRLHVVDERDGWALTQGPGGPGRDARSVECTEDQ
ncbi:hypothetical protein ACFQV8_38715 [Pseudonocardia benzenivorans]